MLAAVILEVLLTFQYHKPALPTSQYVPPTRVSSQQSALKHIKSLISSRAPMSSVTSEEVALKL
jgi:hypothetical protein